MNRRKKERNCGRHVEETGDIRENYEKGGGEEGRSVRKRRNRRRRNQIEWNGEQSGEKRGRRIKSV